MIEGRFIVFEGGEGAGKSTQARMLLDALQAIGLEVRLTREPGGTPGAEAIRQLLLDPPGEGWNAASEALLFAAARADHVERAILPAPKRGAWVISERFVGSSRSHPGRGGGIPDADMTALHRIGAGGVPTHPTYLLDLAAN